MECREEGKNFQRLVDIMARLRKECPWDREQTSQSIKNNLIEEAYELFEAIEKRFETMEKANQQRFEAMEKAHQQRFEAMEKRFEALEKRLSFLQWFMGIGFTFLALLITLLNFLH